MQHGQASGHIHRSLIQSKAYQVLGNFQLALRCLQPLLPLCSQLVLQLLLLLLGQQLLGCLCGLCGRCCIRLLLLPLLHLLLLQLLLLQLLLQLLRRLACFIGSISLCGSISIGGSGAMPNISHCLCNRVLCNSARLCSGCAAACTRRCCAPRHLWQAAGVGRHAICIILPGFLQVAMAGRVWGLQ